MLPAIEIQLMLLLLCQADASDDDDDVLPPSDASQSSKTIKLADTKRLKIPSTLVLVAVAVAVAALAVLTSPHLTPPNPTRRQVYFRISINSRVIILPNWRDCLQGIMFIIGWRDLNDDDEIANRL